MEDQRYRDLLTTEAEAFDKQIMERISNGHVPDLRHTQRCEWFNNNVWRDPYYAGLFYGEIVQQIERTIADIFGPTPISILEIACGPGHISLELARNGHFVTGIDVSKACIEVANKTAQKDDSIRKRDNLHFHATNIFDFEPTNSFDLVVFSCALHHFHDQAQILSKVNSLLQDNGIIFVSEPTKNRLSDIEAEIVLLIRTLLSATGHFHRIEQLDATYEGFERSILSIKNEFSFVDDSGEKTQSPLDNEADQTEMLAELRNQFDELESKTDFTFYDRIIGGLRCESIDQEHKIAEWIKRFDQFLLNKGQTTAQQFHFIGRKKPRKD